MDRICILMFTHLNRLKVADANFKDILTIPQLMLLNTHISVADLSDRDEVNMSVRHERHPLNFSI